MAKRKNEAPYTKKIKLKLKKDGKITPIIESLINELERIEKIRNLLYKSIESDMETGEITEEYTNKAGVTNEIIKPALKEYKAYCQRFNDLTKTLAGLTKTEDDSADKKEDQFEKMLKRRMESAK